MKKTASLALAVLICLSLTAPALAAEFSDVPESHWAYSQIQDAAEKGITSGFTDGTFRPADSVTNAQFAVMLSRAFFAKDVEALEGQAAEEFWYWANLTALDAKGITGGTVLEAEEAWDTYAGEKIDRYDMAMFLYNILTASGKTASEEERAAAQARVTDWDQVPGGKQDAVASVYALGLITGFSDGSFGGSGYMNRAQGCVVIDRLAGRLADQPQAPAPESVPEPVPVPEPDPEPAPAPAGPTLADGSEITEENIRARIESLKAQYPEGMRWTNDNSYFSQALYITGHGCAGFAFLCSDTVFGSLPAVEIHSDFDRVRAGDIIRMSNDTHSVIVLAKNGDSVTIAEGNFNSAIHWGRTVSRAELVSGNFTVTTRWPA